MFKESFATVGAVAALSLATGARAELTDPIPAKIQSSGIKVNLTPLDTAIGGGVTSPI